MNPLAAAVALILLGGITLLCFHHEKRLEEELDTCRRQALRMSIEREFEAQAKDAQILALTKGKEELDKKNKDLEGSMAEREAEFRKRVSEVEGVWLNEKRISLEKEFEIKAKDAQILALTSAHDTMERGILDVNGRNEELERQMAEKDLVSNKDIEELRMNLKEMEADMVYQVQCRDTQVLALTRANEELEKQVLGLRKRNKELDSAITEREVVFKEMAFKLEETWAREKARALREKAEEIVTLKAKVKMLSTDNARLGEIADQEILELKDKLSECHARLRLGRQDTRRFLKFTRVELPQDQPDDEEPADRTLATFPYAPREDSHTPRHQLYDAPADRTRATYAYSPRDRTPSPSPPQQMRRHPLYDAPLPGRPRAI